MDFRFGTALLLGSLVGGYVGAHVAITRGNRYVKVALAVVLMVLGVRFIVGS